MVAVRNVNSESVPIRYQSFDEEDKDYTYTIIQYSKSEPSEKDISIVHMDRRLLGEVKNGENNKRIGWLIPVLSLLSTDHDHAENMHFHRYAHELYKSINGGDYPETAYFFVISDDNFLDFRQKYSVENLVFSFVGFGIYPKFEVDAVYNNELAAAIGEKINIMPSFSFGKSKGFVRKLTHKLCQTEENHYARFMFFYQIIELAMELVFYDRIERYKAEKIRLGIVRDKMHELSSEKKLINLLYEKISENDTDPDLLNCARKIFGDDKEDKYYVETQKSEVLYDLRNTVVHNYYRYNFEEELQYICNHIEIMVHKIFEKLFLDNYFREQFTREYLVE